MAKLGGNAFGGFRGRVGNLVGYNWKGVWCVRSLPASVRNPRTEAQQRHRSMFAEEVRLAGRMGWALDVGLSAVADELHMTPHNVFVKANQGAFTHAEASSPVGGGTADNSISSAPASCLAVDWSALIVSAGPVAPIALGVPVVNDDGVLNVDFEKNPCHLRADSFDHVHLFIYCPALKDGYLAAPVYRKDRHISVSLPDDYIGREIHLYAFATDMAGRASETSYAGFPDGVQSAELPELSEYLEYSEHSDNDCTQLSEQLLFAHSSTAASGGPPSPLPGPKGHGLRA